MPTRDTAKELSKFLPASEVVKGVADRKSIVMAEEVAAVNLEATRLLEVYRSIVRKSRDGMSHDEERRLNEEQANAYEAYWFLQQ